MDLVGPLETSKPNLQDRMDAAIVLSASLRASFDSDAVAFFTEPPVSPIVTTEAVQGGGLSIEVPNGVIAPQIITPERKSLRWSL